MLLALALLAAGCGGADDGDAPPLPTGTPTPAPSGAATPTATAAAPPLWAVGRSGDATLLIRSDDGGRSWSGPLLTGDALTAPSFVDARHGWIADRDRVLESRDGGATWTDLDAALELRSPAAPETSAASSVAIAALLALSDARVIAAAALVTAASPEPDEGVLLVSDDGGRTFVETQRGLPYDEACATTTGVLLARGFRSNVLVGGLQTASIEVSTDRGESWRTSVREQSASPVPLSVGHPVCGDGARAWRVGRRAAIPSGAIYVPEVFATTDAGLGWQAAAEGIGQMQQTELVAGDLASADVGWAVGLQSMPPSAGTPVVVHTTDGGARWSSHVFAGIEGRASGVAALDERRAVVVGSRVVDRLPVIEQALVLVTEDGGAAWTEVELPRAIEALDAVVSPARRAD